MNNLNTETELKKLWLDVVLAMSDGVIAEKFYSSQHKNLYGNVVNISTASDLAFLIGLSATGLRATAWLREKDLFKNVNNLKQAARMHLPLVMVVESDNENYIQQFISYNAFHLQAKNFLEVIDYTIIAHRIAEEALIPGIVLFNGNFKDEKLEIINKNLVARFLGDPHNKINSPTSAQQIIFGKTRRRIVDWFNPDVPAFLNANKKSKGIAYENAAGEFYFKSHVENFISAFLDEYAGLTGKKYKPYYSINRDPNIHPDIPFVVEKSRHPKHEILIQTLNRTYPKLKSKRIISEGEIKEDNLLVSRIPLSLKQYKDNGPPYSRLSGFLDNTLLYYGNEKSEWIADPFQAIPVMPPATANLSTAVRNKKLLPVFDGEKLNENFESLFYCPNASILPLALTVEDIIKSGIKQAANKGIELTGIIPLQKNWTKFSNKRISNLTFQVYFIKDILPAAFNDLTTQMKLEGDKLAMLNHEMQQIIDLIGDIQFTITDKLFRQRNRIDNNSGELLILGIDVNTCNGCELCVRSGEDGVFNLEEETPELLAKLNYTFDLWEQLPDTSSETIERLIEDGDFSSLEAIMLSRNFYMTMSGGGKNQQDVVAKSLLRKVLAVTEAVMQPKYNKLVSSINEKIEALTSNVRKLISETLPISDFSGLSELLQKINHERITLEEIITGLNGREPMKVINKSLIQRKIDLIKELTDLKNNITTGVTGTGRSRYGVVLDGFFRSMAEFPDNVFTSPVILFDGSSATLAEGLTQGRMHHAIDNFKLLRRAEMESQNKYNPALHDTEIANIKWEDLTDDEKGSIGPVILVTSRLSIKEIGSAFYMELMNSKLPVKVILMDDCVYNTDDPAREIHLSNTLTQSLVSSKNAFVFKSSFSDQQHLFEGLITGLNYNGPALFWLFAPDLSGTIKSLPEIYSLASNSRAFTHFDYNPQRDADMISSKLNIDNNPDIEENWMNSIINYEDNDGIKSTDYKITWADWAYSIKDFQKYFSLYDEKSGTAVTVAEFIQMDNNNRNGKVAVIYRLNKLNRLIRYTVDKEIIDATEATLYYWNTLKERAGLITEFPAKLEKKLEQKLSVAYELKRSELVTDFENRIENIEEDHLNKIRQKLKERLMQLSKTGEN